jgi:hypothetical protein
MRNKNQEKNEFNFNTNSTETNYKRNVKVNFSWFSITTVLLINSLSDNERRIKIIFYTKSNMMPVLN